MSPAKMSKVESASRIALEMNKAMNSHDPGTILGLFNEDCVYDAPFPSPDGKMMTGKEAIERYWIDFFKENPGSRFEIEDLFGLGERCNMKWRLVFDKTRHVRGMDVYDVRNDKITRIWSYVKGDPPESV